MNVISIIILLLLTTCNFFAACNEFPDSNLENPETRITGLYYNCEYGYETRIPHSQIGYGTVPPAPDHGFGILLSRNPKAYIWVNAYYALEDESLKEIVNTHLKWIREDYDKTVLEFRKSTKLADLKAERIKVRVTCQNSGNTTIEEKVISIRGNIVYSLNFMADPIIYKKVKAVADMLSKSWRLRRLPCNDN